MRPWQISPDLQSTTVHEPLIGTPAICSPFFTRGGWQWFCERYQVASESMGVVERPKLWFLTCLSAQNAAKGALDLDLLDDLMSQGIVIKHLAGLHAKIILVPPAAMVGSSNLTANGVRKNHELVFQTVEKEQVLATLRLFQDYWDRSTPVTREAIQQCREEAANLPISFSDADLLAARWNSCYVFL